MAIYKIKDQLFYDDKENVFRKYPSNNWLEQWERDNKCKFEKGYEYSPSDRLRVLIKYFLENLGESLDDCAIARGITSENNEDDIRRRISAINKGLKGCNLLPRDDKKENLLNKTGTGKNLCRVCNWVPVDEYGREISTYILSALDYIAFKYNNIPFSVLETDELIGDKRIEQLDELKAWIKDVEPKSITSIIGAPGTGKSKMAFSLCKAIAEDGWQCVWIENGMHENIEDIWMTLKGKVLVIIDDAQLCPNDVDFILDRMEADNPQLLRIRVLLTSYKQLVVLEPKYTLLRFGVGVCKEPITISELESEDREQLLKNYVIKRGGIIDEKTEETINSISHNNDNPLHALMCMDCYFTDGSSEKMGLDYIIARFNAKMMQTVEKHDIHDIKEKERFYKIIKILLVISSIIGPYKIKDIVESMNSGDLVVSDLYYLTIGFEYALKAKEILDDLNLTDVDKVSPLNPNIIGLHYCINTITDEKFLSTDEYNSLIKYVLKTGRQRTIHFFSELEVYAIEYSKFFSTINDTKKHSPRFTAIGCILLNFHSEHQKLLQEANRPIFYSENDNEIYAQDTGDEFEKNFKDKYGLSSSADEMCSLHYVKPEKDDDITERAAEMVISYYKEKDAIIENVVIDKRAFLGEPRIVKYIGATVYDIPCGKGICIFDDGTYYEGGINCSNASYLHGEGKFTHKDGREYECTLYNGIRQGKGEYIWEDQAKYNGDWDLGMRHGVGVMVYPDGETIFGEWRFDQFVGIIPKGIDDTKYQLPSDGGPHFKGEERYMITWEDNALYYGGYFGGRNGFGIMIYPSGKVLEGKWNEGRFEGHIPKGIDDEQYNSLPKTIVESSNGSIIDNYQKWKFAERYSEILDKNESIYDMDNKEIDNKKGEKKVKRQSRQKKDLEKDK